MGGRRQEKAKTSPSLMTARVASVHGWLKKARVLVDPNFIGPRRLELEKTERKERVVAVHGSTSRQRIHKKGLNSFLFQKEKVG
jgi:hypothetical protein